MFCFCYLSKSEATPFEGLKKKKQPAEMRPLLITRIIIGNDLLSNCGRAQQKQPRYAPLDLEHEPVIIIYDFSHKLLFSLKYAYFQA